MNGAIIWQTKGVRRHDTIYLVDYLTSHLMNSCPIHDFCVPKPIHYLLFFVTITARLEEGGQKSQGENTRLAFCRPAFQPRYLATSIPAKKPNTNTKNPTYDQPCLAHASHSASFTANQKIYTHPFPSILHNVPLHPRNIARYPIDRSIVF